MVNVIVKMCQKLHSMNGFEQVVLSGGVFLNEFMVANTLIELRKVGIKAFTHRTVPCGDGGIALGQLMVAQHQCAN